MLTYRGGQRGQESAHDVEFRLDVVGFSALSRRVLPNRPAVGSCLRVWFESVWPGSPRKPVTAEHDPSGRLSLRHLPRVLGWRSGPS
ncbi:hypothetical protein GCM10010112_83670 [Actinoplanes lobatus]|uniref:Uncharacterized protein n=1 Tax=Actinoplanes lobatus TaxID=113568 RepID=A0ABQ4AYB4_9ACTN|nr:hypothetical protein GCM10010112_83670 [Actinoplanes lobatus]GIE46009.1 hypothetical protein Alo02nite_89070 [Actinoplanes lobatus]